MKNTQRMVIGAVLALVAVGGLITAMGRLGIGKGMSDGMKTFEVTGICEEE